MSICEGYAQMVNFSYILKVSVTYACTPVLFKEYNYLRFGTCVRLINSINRCFKWMCLIYVYNVDSFSLSLSLISVSLHCEKHARETYESSSIH